MQFIGSRISYQSKDNVFSVVIAAGNQRYQEGLILAWLLSWILVGLYFMSQLFTDIESDLKRFIGLLLVFWAYYLYRIGKVFFWRKYGYESLRFLDDKLVYRKVIKGLGKPKTYFVDNLSDFKANEVKDTNVLKFLSNSFWTIGTDTIFIFHGKARQLNFGKQLTNLEAVALQRVLNKELARRKRKSA